MKIHFASMLLFALPVVASASVSNPFDAVLSHQVTVAEQATQSRVVYCSTTEKARDVISQAQTAFEQEVEHAKAVFQAEIEAISKDGSFEKDADLGNAKVAELQESLNRAVENYDSNLIRIAEANGCRVEIGL